MLARMLRTLLRSDMSAVLSLEEATHVVPWSLSIFESCFESGCLGRVIEIEGKVIGFIIFSLCISECHILNLCIAYYWQRQGWGSKLLKHILMYAKQHGASIAYLEVRRSNSRAISLYKKLEFHIVGERKEYYPTVVGHEDALIFAKSL
jgi:ribosomal-protein-alanine N-acetyltransferase